MAASIPTFVSEAQIHAGLDGAAEKRPQHAMLAGKLNTLWALREVYSAVLYSILIDHHAGKLKKFLTESSWRQKSCLREAAANHRHPEIRPRLLAALDAQKALEGRRNEVVHWVWSSPQGMPDAILLVAPVAWAEFFGAVSAWDAAGRSGKQPALAPEHMRAYSSLDLQELLNDVETQINHFRALGASVSMKTDADRLNALDEFLNHPNIKPRLAGSA